MIDEQQLNQTEYTQPAILTAGVIAWRIRQETDVQDPDVSWP